jgi:hypothetical protein
MAFPPGKRQIGDEARTNGRAATVIFGRPERIEPVGPTLLALLADRVLNEHVEGSCLAARGTDPVHVGNYRYGRRNLRRCSRGHEAGLHVDHDMSRPLRIDALEKPKTAPPLKGDFDDIVFELHLAHEYLCDVTTYCCTFMWPWMNDKSMKDFASLRQPAKQDIIVLLLETKKAS